MKKTIIMEAFRLFLILLFTAPEAWSNDLVTSVDSLNGSAATCGYELIFGERADDCEYVREIQGRESGNVPVNSNEKFYFIIFGFQDSLNLAHHSHTFATFIKADRWTKDVREVQTISWLPENFSGSVPIFLSRPEVGKNYSLEESLDFTERYQFQAAMWGPYEIPKSVFDRAMVKIANLESGKILYHAPDSREAHQRAFLLNESGSQNCMHAVSDVVCFHRTGLDWGISGSRHIFEDVFKPLLVNPSHTEDWLIRKLRLDRYKIQRMQ